MGGFGLDVAPYATGPHFNNPWQSEHAPDQTTSNLFPITTSFVLPAKEESAMNHQMAYPQIPIPSNAISETNALNIHFQAPPELHRLNTDLGHGSPSSYRSSSESAFPPTPASESVSYQHSVPSSAVQSGHLSHFESPIYVSAASHAQALDRERSASCISQPTLNATNFFGTPIDMARQRQNSVLDMNRQIGVPQISFDESFESARNMAAPSQRPMSRSMYSRESIDPTGYVSSVSHTPSISSGYLSSSYPGSMSDSMADMGMSEMSGYDMHGTRMLPRPTSLLGGNLLPAPQSMMSQFSSKVASSSQKKHKCKVCDKRFTRPSSLQTHMYSHTGEKRTYTPLHSTSFTLMLTRYPAYLCEVPGCGRHFSVVSNLRRHRKVHKHHE